MAGASDLRLKQKVMSFQRSFAPTLKKAREINKKRHSACFMTGKAAVSLSTEIKTYGYIDTKSK